MADFGQRSRPRRGGSSGIFGKTTGGTAESVEVAISFQRSA